MQEIDGRGLAKRLRTELKEEIGRLGYRPGLGVVLVGHDPASEIYVGLKEKACREVGIESRKVALPADAPEGAVMAEIDRLNSDPRIDGFIIQLPLPKHLDADRMIAAMLPSKDADGFHQDNIARLIGGQPRIRPVLPQAILALIAAAGEEIRGKRALVASNSRVFYEPLQPMLREAGLESSWLESRSPRLAVESRQADVLIVAAGRIGLIAGRHLKPGAIAVDIGINRLPDGSLTGDIDREGTESLPGWITPVPGGVGPMTVAYLLKNAVELAKQHRN